MSWGSWLFDEPGFIDTSGVAQGLRDAGMDPLANLIPQSKAEQIGFALNPVVYLGGYGVYKNIADIGQQGKDEAAGIDAATAAAVGPTQAGIDAAGDALNPYNTAGQQATLQQQALMGLLGPAAQQEAYSMIENSPAFQSLRGQGETAILQNASATGGLRGGNTQAALANFAPDLLNQLIQQQLQGLSGISGQGLSAGGQFAGIQAGLQGDLAGIQSGGILAKLQADAQRRADRKNDALTLLGVGAKAATGGVV